MAGRSFSAALPGAGSPGLMRPGYPGAVAVTEPFDQVASWWSFTTLGSPATDGYFIITETESESVSVGDVFILSSFPGQTHTVSSISTPFGGFVNIFFSPAAPTAVDAGATASQIVAFPTQELGLQVELLLGDTWTDISEYVDGPITITRGKPDESTDTSPAEANLTLYNGDGRFTHLNPAGPYFGKLGRNTQIRVSVPEPITYLRSQYDNSSWAQCPNSSSLEITGDIDIQIDAALDNWAGGYVLASMWNDDTGERSWNFWVDNEGKLTFMWSPTGSTSYETVASTVPIPAQVSPQRLCVRVTFQPSAGTVTFYTSPPGLSSPVWTQLGESVVFGATTLYASTAPLALGYIPDGAMMAWYADYYPEFYFTSEWQGSWLWGFSGKMYAAQILDGIGGTAVANPDFTAQTPGTTSFTDAAGNTWTLEGTASIENRNYRIHGEVAAWPQSWGVGGSDAVIAIQAAGLLRRIGMGETPTNSAMYRAATRLTGASAPVAYWPMEDGQFATEVASGLPNGTPMQITGPVEMADNSDFGCSNALPNVNGGTLTGDVPAYDNSNATANCLTFLMELPSAGEVAGAVIATMWFEGASISYVQLTNTGSGGLSMQGFSTTTKVFDTGAYAFGADGMQALVSMQITTTGYLFQVLPINTSNPALSTGSIVTGTYSMPDLGHVSRVVFNINGSVALTDTVFGHALVQLTEQSLGNWIGPANAWAGEYAAFRFQRLCMEEGIPYAGRGSALDTVAMGVQGLETISELLQECIDSDQSIWVELRTAAGFGYRTRISAGNQQPVVAFDYQQDHLTNALTPTEDDQTTVNDVTVTQEYDGSSARQVATTGPLSINPPPDGVGRYDTEVTVNIEYDNQLPSVANWILYKSTVDEPRYPEISTSLANSGLSPQMWYQIQDLDIGDLLTIANPPPWLPPGTINQVVNQANETLFDHQYDLSWVGIPATAWNVCYTNDPLYGICDTEGSTLDGALSANLSTAESLFSTVDPSGLVQGSLSGWVAYEGTVALDHSATYPGGQFPWSAVYTSNGTSGGALEGSGTPFAVTAGDSYCTSALVYFPDGGSVQIGFDWLDGSTYLSTSTVDVTVAAETWTWIGSGAQTAPTSATNAYQRVGPATAASGTILVVQASYAWQGAVQVATTAGPLWTTASASFPFGITASPIPGLRSEQMIVTGVSGSSSPQTFTVARGASGVCPAQASGNDVRLFIPPIVAL